MSTPSEFRDPATRQQHPDLVLRRTEAALKTLLDKLAKLEAAHGASPLSDKSGVLTSVGVLRGIRAALEGA